MEASNGWLEYRRSVLDTMKSLSEEQKEQRRQIQAIQVKLAMLAGAWIVAQAVLSVWLGLK